jgi:hypothetical protein
MTVRVPRQARDEQLLGAAAALRLLGRGRGPPPANPPAHAGQSRRIPPQRLAEVFILA